MTSTFPRFQGPGMHRGIGALVAGASARQPVLLVS
jgi:hypothetical protein